MTVVLAWMTFVFKDSGEFINIQDLKIVSFLAVISLMIFVLSLIVVVFNIINIPKLDINDWALFFVLGWLLFIVSLCIFYYRYIYEKYKKYPVS